MASLKRGDFTQVLEGADFLELFLIHLDLDFHLLAAVRHDVALPCAHLCYGLPEDHVMVLRSKGSHHISSQTQQTSCVSTVLNHHSPKTWFST